VRRLLIGLLLLAAAGCSEPPQKEIDQAQSAIDAARAAGADKDSVDKEAAGEYADAVATLQKAHASVDQRDYRQALSYALDARQRAVEATRLVTDARARMRTGAEAEYKADTDRVTRLETLLRTAEDARVSAHELRESRATLDAARTSLQEARKLMDAGNFAEASSALAGVRENLDGAVKTMEPISQRAAKAGKARRH
jgi:hypothetical protein